MDACLIVLLAAVNVVTKLIEQANGHIMKMLNILSLGSVHSGLLLFLQTLDDFPKTTVFAQHIILLPTSI